MGEQLLNHSILDQFINSHEQSYEEFLNTFTYLWKEDEGKTNQGSKADSLRNAFAVSELPAKPKQRGSPERSKETWVSLPPQRPDENKPMMDESRKAGSSGGNDVSLSEGEKVDKYLDLEDIKPDEETCSGSLLLPGQVEETVTYRTPFVEEPVEQILRTLSVAQPSGSTAQELLGDEVQPFSLDEEFDYDSVVLTPKFSKAELKAISELSEEKKMGTEVKSA